MTKHTDSSRSADSGVSGNAQTSAREIRIDHEAIRKLAQRVVDAHDANDGMRLSQAIDDLDAAFPPDDLLKLLSECSRLASRVEELKMKLGIAAGQSQAASGVNGAQGEPASSEHSRGMKHTPHINCPTSKRTAVDDCGEAFMVYGVHHSCKLGNDHVGAHWCNCPPPEKLLAAHAEEKE